MQLRGFAVKWVAGANAPAGFKAEEAEVDVSLDLNSAAAVPAAVLSVLYADRRDIVELVRLAGDNPDSEWRVSLEIGKRRFRLTRSYSWSSVVLEAQDPMSGDWGVVARGGDQCRTMLGRLFPVAPREVVAALNFAINPTKPPRSLDPDREVSRVELLSNSAMIGFGESPGSQDSVALDEQDRLRIGQQYQDAATRELLDDSIRRLAERLGDVMQKMGGLVDDTGELGRVARALAELPRIRPISNSEREALTEPDARRTDLERRIVQATDEVEGVRRDLAAGAWYRNVPLILGLLAGIAVTIFSLTGGVPARKFALGNIVAFGIALVGGIRHIGALERAAATERKRSTVERRLAQLTEERTQFEATYAKLTRELGLRSIAEYDQRVEKRKRLEERERLLTEANRAALDRPEYAALDQQKRKLDVELAERRAALSLLPDNGMSSRDLATTLRKAGWDPAVALWDARTPAESGAESVSRLLEIAQQYGQFKDDMLAPGLADSWVRLARHVTCEGLEGLTIREGRIACDDREDLVRMMPGERSWALVESLRLSLLLALRNAGVEGIPDFIVRVHPFRFDDRMVEDHLRGVYEKLSARFQIICVDSPQ